MKGLEKIGMHIGKGRYLKMASALDVVRSVTRDILKFRPKKKLDWVNLYKGFNGHLGVLDHLRP